MERKYFLNGGIPPPLHFDPFPMPNWHSLSSTPELNFSPEQYSDCFLNPSWEKSTDQFSQFESALSSTVSSNSTITKITNTSPSKLHYPIVDQFGKEEKLPNLGNLMPLNPKLPSVSADPGFAERAAKFSCFGSRSFNVRVSQLNTELPYRSSSLMGVKLPRVLSSPNLLKPAGSPMGAQEIKKSTQTHVEIGPTNGLDSKLSKVMGCSASSNEGSSVSEQIPSGENPRKRKAVSRGKSKENASTKVAEAEDDQSVKRSKSSEGNGSENGSVKTEETEPKATNPKPSEPPKDYIHVRARRGQATDSHSLAERVRREKISERMKLLQDLVPNCNKVTGKALMLDEIINYVQSLQRQVEFLSMKLASVDFNMDGLLSKNEFQPNGSLSHPIYPLGDPMETTLCRNIAMQLTPVDEFGQGLPQFPTLCEDDLQSIVLMGFGQNQV